MIASENPYATPAEGSAVTAERRDFIDIATPKLKSLRYDSRSIRTVCALLILGLLINGAFLVIMVDPLSYGNRRAEPYVMIAGGIMLVQLVVLYGFIRRPAWARPVAFFAFVPVLWRFPIGTLIATLALIAVCRSKELFGPSKLPHRALDAEWKYRKKNKVP